MRFKKISIHNIRSYNREEMNFPEGSLLISGDIGSGKTSILLAIEYALFGLQPGQKGTSLLRNNTNHGEVSLEFEISGKNVIIERKLKRTQKGVSNEYAAISIDGEKQESSITEIKSKIVELLGYPPEFVKKNNALYRYTVYSPQEKMKQIILEDPETRVDTLRHIFGVDKYRQIKNNLAILVNNLRGNAKALQLEIKTLEQEKEDIEKRKISQKEIKERIKEKERELNSKIEMKEELEQELKEIEEKILEKKKYEVEIEKAKILHSTKRELFSSLIKQRLELERNIQDIGELFNEENYLALISKLSSKREKIDELSSRSLEVSGAINSLEKNKKEIISKKDKIFDIEICPTCLQDVSESHKHIILNETEGKMAQINSEIQDLKPEEKNLLEEITAIKKELSLMEKERINMEILREKTAQAKKAESNLKDIEEQRRSLEKDIDFIINHIDNLKKKVLENSVFDTQYKKKEFLLKEALREERKSEILLAELNKELELSHKEIAFFESIIKKKELSKKNLAEVESLIDWLSSHFQRLIELIEQNILLKLRSEFSNLFRKWFSILVPESSLDSQIDENFTPIIIRGESEMDYSFLSGGERTAVALAYRLALNQTLNSLISKIQTKGLIILDEPTDGFSETQINKVRDILEELNAAQLIIVSHEPKIEGFVDNVVKVAKSGDVSHILRE